MAGQHTWTWDAPTGTYKSHALSADLIRAAIADSKTMQFVEPAAGYGRKKGETITFPRASNLSEPTSAALNETVEIPEDTMSLSTVGITVQELGRAVTWTGMSDDLATISIPDIAKDLLQDQMSLVLDKLAMDAFKTAKLIYVPTAAADGEWETDGDPTNTALVNIGYYHIEEIRDAMVSTYHMRPYVGDEYMCLASTKFLRGLKQDSKWESWNRYTTPEAKAKGEVGKIEGIRFIEVNNTNVLSGSKGTGSVLGEAVFFGASPVKMATAVPPHLRMKVPEDYGRSHGCAWYGILNFGLIWDTANPGEANVIRVTSA